MKAISTLILTNRLRSLFLISVFQTNIVVVYGAFNLPFRVRSRHVFSVLWQWT